MRSSNSGQLTCSSLTISQEKETNNQTTKNSPTTTHNQLRWKISRMGALDTYSWHFLAGPVISSVLKSGSEFSTRSCTIAAARANHLNGVYQSCRTQIKKTQVKSSSKSDVQLARAICLAKTDFVLFAEQMQDCGPACSFFYSAGARDKWSQSPIKETKMKLYNTLYTRKPREIPTSHSENPN